MWWLLLLLAAGADGQTGRYYGLPLGSFHYSADKTAGSVYVADPRNLMIVNLEHDGTPGCTTLMAGPPRPSDTDLSPDGAGVLLSIGLQTRFKRSRAATSGFHSFFNWPFEFGHLRVSESPGINSAALSNNAFSGIELDLRDEAPPPPLPTTTTSRPTEPPTTPTPTTAPRRAPWHKETLIVFNNRPDTTTSTTERSTTTVITEKPTTSTVAATQPLTEGPSSAPPTLPTTTPPATTTLQTTLRQTTERREIQTRAPRPTTTTTRRRPPAPTPQYSHTGGLVVLDGRRRAPSNVHQSFFGPLPRAHELQRLATSTPATTSTTTLPADVNREHGYTAVFGRQPPPSPAQAPAHSPPAHAPPSDRGLVFVFGQSQEVASDRQSVAVSAPSPPVSEVTTATPLFRVIEDPRARRRKLYPRPTLPPDFYRPTATAPALPQPPPGELYVLPRIRDSTVLVRLPTDANVGEYEWFGVYDHCQGHRTAFVNTRGVSAPQESVLPGIQGWQFGVSSGPIHLLNCNTLLIRAFTYTGADFADAFIYVGVGDFPQSIVQQVKAYVVGMLPEQPLHNYQREDIMVRLPRGWKTFDTNFLSVYQPSERVSFGHALIPPVVVPPCDDQF